MRNQQDRSSRQLQRKSNMRTYNGHTDKKTTVLRTW